jgi:hypothetical protein
MAMHSDQREWGSHLGWTELWLVLCSERIPYFGRTRAYMAQMYIRLLHGCITKSSCLCLNPVYSDVRS